jgi:hypothetical protein
VPDGTATAKAIDYSLNRWPALTRFLEADQALGHGTQELALRPASANAYFSLHERGSATFGAHLGHARRVYGMAGGIAGKDGAIFRRIRGSTVAEPLSAEARRR